MCVCIRAFIPFPKCIGTYFLHALSLLSWNSCISSLCVGRRLVGERLPHLKVDSRKKKLNEDLILFYQLWSTRSESSILQVFVYFHAAWECVLAALQFYNGKSFCPLKWHWSDWAKTWAVKAVDAPLELHKGTTMVCDTQCNSSAITCSASMHLWSLHSPRVVTDFS